MAKVNARLVVKSAPLAGEFGLKYATELFGAEALALLPKFTRGPKHGMLKGFIIWVRCEKGGWSRYGVAYPNTTVRAWIGAGQFSPEGAALCGQWLGREQQLCGSACYLGPQNRAKEMQQRAAEAAERAAQIAEERSGIAQSRVLLGELLAAGTITQEVHDQIKSGYDRKEGLL